MRHAYRIDIFDLVFGSVLTRFDVGVGVGPSNHHPAIWQQCPVARLQHSHRHEHMRIHSRDRVIQPCNVRSGHAHRGESTSCRSSRVIQNGSKSRVVSVRLANLQLRAQSTLYRRVTLDTHLVRDIAITGCAGLRAIDDQDLAVWQNGRVGHHYYDSSPEISKTPFNAKMEWARRK